MNKEGKKKVKGMTMVHRNKSRKEKIYININRNVYIYFLYIYGKVYSLTLIHTEKFSQCLLFPVLADIDPPPHTKLI